MYCLIFPNFVQQIIDYLPLPPFSTVPMLFQYKTLILDKTLTISDHLDQSIEMLLSDSNTGK